MIRTFLAVVLLAVSAIAQTAVVGNGVSGAGAAGTANTVPKFNSGGVGNSSITDDGTTVAIGDVNTQLPLAGVFKFSTDSGISRTAAGSFAFGNGTAADTSGTLRATILWIQGSSNGGFTHNFNNTGIGMGSATVIGWTSGAAQNANDSAISRISAALFAFGNGTQGDFSGTTKVASDIVAGANGETWTQGSSTELLTIAAAATTDTTGNLLPANSIIEAVVVRVNTVIPTAATFTVGDATTAARFATGIAVAATTTAVGLTHVDQTGAAGPKQTAAAKVRITPNLTPGTATGVVRITVFYRTFVPPTQ